MRKEKFPLGVRQAQKDTQRDKRYNLFSVTIIYNKCAFVNRFYGILKTDKKNKK